MKVAKERKKKGKECSKRNKKDKVWKKTKN